ncbi:Uncharacterized protein SAPIO_CDS10681 [Scedosporium apiospermum]|uniref:Uncharacterized protein n=1 Tax=Pseudallescheria apiosperma TaxID=563466 RepID=A0A084FUA3_PSEDA|nr:Uncharacterized protein SAPIO_CDS10681 [Scedosporium apiospermum]KEZ38665.1 Uncharacterized protein SAPIO_CDS10681 [Scedosporium apiospermum]
MAFHQQTRQSVPRPAQSTSRDGDQLHTSLAPQVQQPPDESQTWVLFAPADNATASSYLGESERSLETPRASDLGDLDSNLRLDGDLDSHTRSVGFPAAFEDDVAEDDAELDSLDSHLPDFRATHNPYAETPAAPTSQNMPVLPCHDGLGSFRVEQPAGAPDMQEQLYAFEKFNPHRINQRDDVPDFPELMTDPDRAHKMQRIESWRLEQSRLLLEHIQKETRSRSLSQSTIATRTHQSVRSSETENAQDGSDKTVSGVVQGEHDNVDWHQGSTPEPEVQSEGILSRVAKSLIKELIGIDDRLLSILFGESRPDDGEDLEVSAMRPSEERSWQLRMLETIAKELGLLINRLSHHPGAFSSYVRTQRMPLPYAGLPVIPEMPATGAAQVQQQGDQDDLSAAIPEFQPTVPRQSPATDAQSTNQQTGKHDASASNQHPDAFTQQEWEQDLDIRLAFRYLRSRFGSRSSPAPTTTGTSHLATSSTQDIAAKIARLRESEHEAVWAEE